MIVFQFFTWTLVVYFIHRAVHVFPAIGKYHLAHHKYVRYHHSKIGWRWTNLLLWNDNWKTTVDLWTTEVIPAILICVWSGSWWFLLAYWLWSAFVQERIDHDSNFHCFPLASGRWHMEHHKNSRVNFGIIIPLWDIIFETYKHVDRT